VPVKTAVASDGVWRKVKPFKEADAPIKHFLSDDECVRLVNAGDGSFGYGTSDISCALTVRPNICGLGIGSVR
jgi:hypothetical protein